METRGSLRRWLGFPLLLVICHNCARSADTPSATEAENLVKSIVESRAGHELTVEEFTKTDGQMLPPGAIAQYALEYSATLVLKHEEYWGVTAMYVARPESPYLLEQLVVWQPGGTRSPQDGFEKPSTYPESNVKRQVSVAGTRIRIKGTLYFTRKESGWKRLESPFYREEFVCYSPIGEVDLSVRSQCFSGTQ